MRLRKYNSANRPVRRYNYSHRSTLRSNTMVLGPSTKATTFFAKLAPIRQCCMCFTIKLHQPLTFRTISWFKCRCFVPLILRKVERRRPKSHVAFEFREIYSTLTTFSPVSRVFVAVFVMNGADCVSLVHVLTLSPGRNEEDAIVSIITYGTVATFSAGETTSFATETTVSA